MELLDLLNPVLQATRDRTPSYKVEPYVVAADVYHAEGHVGRGGWTWYTGSAAWMYRVALETVLGFDLSGNSLRINPCIPAAWPGFEIVYRRHQKRYRILVDNPQGVQSGVKRVTCNGRECESKEIALDAEDCGLEIHVVMG
jgi:cyclic beta-1,2-glucan synthetase